MLGPGRGDGVGVVGVPGGAEPAGRLRGDHRGLPGRLGTHPHRPGWRGGATGWVAGRACARRCGTSPPPPGCRVGIRRRSRSSWPGGASACRPGRARWCSTRSPAPAPRCVAARQLGRRAIGIEAQRGVLRSRPSTGSPRAPSTSTAPPDDPAAARQPGVCTGAVLASKPSAPVRPTPRMEVSAWPTLRPAPRRRRRRPPASSPSAPPPSAPLLGAWWALRHPRTTLAVAVPVAAYSPLGPAAAVALVAAWWSSAGGVAALASGELRSVLPGGVAAQRACTRWGWRQAMTMAGLGDTYRHPDSLDRGPGRASSAGRSRRYVPKLGRVRSDRWCDRVTVRLLAGQHPGMYADRTDHLAHTFGARSCRVECPRPGRVVLVFRRRDPLADVVPALPIARRAGPVGPAGRAASRTASPGRCSSPAPTSSSRGRPGRGRGR